MSDYPKTFVKKDPRTGKEMVQIATRPVKEVQLRHAGWVERKPTSAAQPAQVVAKTEAVDKTGVARVGPGVAKTSRKES